MPSVSFLSNPNATSPGPHLSLSDFAHLGRQGWKQGVIGPMQDDEALLLFGLVRASHVCRILEIGGLDGFSARNFLAALRPKNQPHPDKANERRAVAAPKAACRLYTIDRRKVDRLSAEHVVLTKDARDFNASDIGNQRIDLRTRQVNQTSRPS